jgi:uncharacterized membrane protein required for colicin V production
MGIILDVLLIAIILLCTWRGFRAGIINSICGILAVIIAIYGGNLISQTYSGEFTGMLEPFVSGYVESIEGKIMDHITGNDEEDFTPVADIDDLETDDVSGVCTAVMRQLGISEKSSRKLADEIATKVDKTNSKMVDALTDVICTRVAYIVLFAIGFLLIVIIFSAIGNVLDLAFGLPGLENVNHILGAIFGAAKGFLIIVVITCFCRYLGLILKTDLLNSTIIMKKLVESNFLANLLEI